MESKLYVGNLSFKTSEDDLRAHFAKAGVVQSVAIIKDRATGRSKGFAFVEMGSQVDAEKAIAMFNGQQFMDRALTVNIARPKEDRGDGFGGGRGGGYGNRGPRRDDRNRRGGGGGQSRY
jgi:RNA recognition motif-containing protein